MYLAKLHKSIKGLQNWINFVTCNNKYNSMFVYNNQNQQDKFINNKQREANNYKFTSKN